MKRILNNRTSKNIFTLFFLLVTCALTQIGINMLFCTLGTYFANFMEFASFIIAYSIIPIYFMLFYKYNYINRSSSFGLFTFAFIMILIKGFGVYAFLLRFEQFFLDFEYHALTYLFPLDIIILFILEFIVDGYIIYKGVKNKGVKNYLKPLTKKKSLLLILLTPLAYLNFYYIGCGLHGFIAINNLTLEHGIGFAIIMLMCLLLLYNYYFIFREKRDTKCRQNSELIGAILSLVILVSFITYRAIYPNFVVSVGKPLFVIDFFGSYDIGPTVLFISHSFFILRYLIKSIALKRLA